MAMRFICPKCMSVKTEYLMEKSPDGNTIIVCYSCQARTTMKHSERQRYEIKEEANQVSKKTVVFDFDGVIHSYTSGWKGFDVIPDPPVPGIKEAIEEIKAAGYETVIVSSRCASENGQFAIAKYLAIHGIEVDRIMSEKPPALVYIDDRAITFTGDTKGLLDQIENFQPWRLQ